MKIPDTPNIFAFTWLKGEDEFNCPTTCPQDEFQFTCSQFNGKLLPLECINEEKRCDGFEDCQNGSDESNCQLTCLEENQFQCVHERYTTAVAKRISTDPYNISTMEKGSLWQGKTYL